MMNKKAQITMETILIYGIIAIVVLTGIGALIYFGVFDLGTYLPDKCSFVTGDLGCEQWVAEGGSDMEFGIRNNLNKLVIVESLNMTQPEGFLAFTGTGAGCGGSCCYMDCGSASANPKGAVPCVEAGACQLDPSFRGQKIKLNMVVEYAPTGGAITQKSGGEMIVKVQ